MKRTAAAIISILTAFALLLALAACTGTGLAANTESGKDGKDGNDGNTGNTDTSGGSGDGQGFAYNKIGFITIEDLTTLPQAVQDAIEAMNAERGFAYYKDGSDFIIAVFLGERSTGGYAVEVKYVEDIEGITRISAEEKIPGKDDMVTQALTYPFTVIRLTGIAENFEVVDQNGVKFENKGLIADGADKPGVSALTHYGVTGKYTGQIDGNSIEIDVDKNSDIAESGKPMAFRLTDETKPFFDSESEEYLDLQEGDLLKFDYVTNEHGQLIILHMEKQ